MSAQNSLYCVTAEFSGMTQPLAQLSRITWLPFLHDGCTMLYSTLPSRPPHKKGLGQTSSCLFARVLDTKVL